MTTCSSDFLLNTCGRVKKPWTLDAVRKARALPEQAPYKMALNIHPNLPSISQRSALYTPDEATQSIDHTENMDNNGTSNIDEAARQRDIDRLLEGVNSVADLTVENIQELRAVSEQSLTIEKFNVTPREYLEWADDRVEDLQGVELDAQKGRLVLKAYPSLIHEVTVTTIMRMLQPLVDRLETATQTGFLWTGSTGK
jgi:hypothetical protein